MWMNFVFPLIWMLGVTFSMDEMTMRFKGHHTDRIRMTYKSEDDGLQAYDLFNKGYTYQIFMCNATVSKTYLAKRLSPLDAREMALFDTVEEKTPSMRNGQSIQLTPILQGSVKSREKITDSWCYKERN